MLTTDDRAVPGASALIDLKRHELSKALRPLTRKEIDGLRESIRAVGILDPIVIFEDKVLDGWHRYTIAKEVGAEHIPTEELEVGKDPRAFVRGRMRGRNMNASQLALAEVKLNEWRPHGVNDGVAPGATPAASNAEMASNVGVSPRTIRHAKAVAQATEAVQQAVEDGKLSAKRGAAIAKLPAEQQPAAVLKPVALVTPIHAGEHDVSLEDGALCDKELMDELQAENVALRAQVAAGEADDLKAEAIKWRRSFDHAERRQAELMQLVAQREAELKKLQAERKRIAEAVACEDMRKVVAMVEAMAGELSAVTHAADNSFKRARRAEMRLERIAEWLNVPASELEAAIEARLAEAAEVGFPASTAYLAR